jgi:hypothetical protein
LILSSDRNTVVTETQLKVLAHVPDS